MEIFPKDLIADFGILHLLETPSESFPTEDLHWEKIKDFPQIVDKSL